MANPRKRQLTLDTFYVSNKSHLERKPRFATARKKRKPEQLKLHHFYAYDCSHFGDRPWYIRHTITHILWVFTAAYYNNNLIPHSLRQETNFQFEAEKKFYTKIVESKVANSLDRIVFFTKTSYLSGNNGTPQKANIIKVITGYIRSVLEEICSLQMPAELAMIVVKFYGKIIMDSNILTLNHQNIIQYTINQRIPRLNNLKLRQTHKFHALFGKNYFLVVVKTNTNDILALYSADKIRFSLLLQTSIRSIPVKYRLGSVDIDIYHFPNKFQLNHNQILKDIFVDLNNLSNDPNLCIKGIGSLSDHYLTNSQTLIIESSEHEVFIFE